MKQDATVKRQGLQINVKVCNKQDDKHHSVYIH